MSYHRQTNQKARRLNKFVASHFLHYIFKRQKPWNKKVQALVYDSQIYRSTGFTPFDLSHTQNHPGIVPGDPTSVLLQSASLTRIHTEAKHVTRDLISEFETPGYTKLSMVQERQKAS